jgi:hypothetical protein
MGQIFVCTDQGIAYVTLPGPDRLYAGDAGIERFVREAPALAYQFVAEFRALSEPRRFFLEAAWTFMWPWAELLEVEACEPYPALRVSWRTRGARADERIFAPELTPIGRVFSVSRDARDRFAAIVTAVFDAIEDHAPPGARLTVVRGWLDIPDAPWEEVDTMPEGGSAEGDGVYRSASRGAGVIASRAAPTAFESLLAWLASSPDRRWRETPREISVTREHVYARMGNARAYRVPLEALRSRRGDRDGDLIYTFGRGTFLLLLHRDECPVRDALDARLARASD